MVNCLPEFEYFTVFLKNKNIIFKIRRSKVTDYAALTLFILIDYHKHTLKTILVRNCPFCILRDSQLNFCKMYFHP